MKKIALLLAFVISLESVFAWGGLGHKVIVEIAKAHLTPKAKKNIERYMPYDIVKDASWMDYHRKDKAINYTTHWHSFRYDKKSLKHDLNFTLRRGDVVRALEVAEYNLARYRELTDSAVVMNLRMAIHFVGDMHCPCHAVPYRTRGAKLMYKGKPIGFHKFFDKAPALVHPKKSYREISADIDDYSKRKYKSITAGTVKDWADDTAKNVDFVWNNYNKAELEIEITPELEKVVDTQLRNAGYRLAAFLNRYFGK